MANWFGISAGTLVLQPSGKGWPGEGESEDVYRGRIDAADGLQILWRGRCDVVVNVRHLCEREEQDEAPAQSQ